MKKAMVLILMVATASSWAASKVYKWVDAEGRIHYSGQKPPGQEVETLSVKTGAKASTKTEVSTEESSAEATDEGTEAQADAEAQAAAKAQLAKADKVNEKRLCDTARNNMASLNQSVRVTQKDVKTGEVRRLNDDERVAAMAKAQKAIRQYCR